MSVTPVRPTKFAKTWTGIEGTFLVNKEERDFLSVQLDLAFRQFEHFINYGEPITHQESSFLGLKTTVVLSENKIQMPVFSAESWRRNTIMPDRGYLVLRLREHPASVKTSNVLLVQIVD